MVDLIKFSPEVVSGSPLRQEDKDILLRTGFPKVNFPFGSFNTYTPLPTIASVINTRENQIFIIAEDKELMSQIVIRLDDHTLCFYESWDNRFTLINSQLQHFLAFYEAFDEFFTANPEFNDEDFTADENRVKKVKHLEHLLRSVDETPFAMSHNAWSDILETMSFSE